MTPQPALRSGTSPGVTLRPGPWSGRNSTSATDPEVIIDQAITGLQRALAGLCTSLVRRCQAGHWAAPGACLIALLPPTTTGSGRVAARRMTAARPLNGSLAAAFGQVRGPSRDGETLEAVSRLSTMVRAPVRGLYRKQQVEELGGVAPDTRPLG